MGALSAVIHSVPDGVSVFGIPAIPVEQIPGLRRGRKSKKGKEKKEGSEAPVQSAGETCDSS